MGDESGKRGSDFPMSAERGCGASAKGDARNSPGQAAHELRYERDQVREEVGQLKHQLAGARLMTEAQTRLTHQARAERDEFRAELDRAIDEAVKAGAEIGRLRKGIRTAVGVLPDSTPMVRDFLKDLLPDGFGSTDALAQVEKHQSILTALSALTDERNRLRDGIEELMDRTVIYGSLGALIPADDLRALLDESDHD